VSQRKSDPGIKRAYQIVEEMMLLANELVARWLGQRGAPSVYRVHGKPDEEKLERLGNAAIALAAPFDLDAMSEPKGVSTWLKHIGKHPAREVLEGLLLRSLKQAVYDTANIGHFGLASAAYVHFTSPIRRYPDLLVHRGIKRLLRGRKPDKTPSALEALGAAATHSSFRERAAMQVEREVVDLYRALFMRDKIGEVYRGRVTALLGSGIIVAVPEPYVEVLVRFEDMGPDRYEISDDELSYVGLRSGEVIALGSPATVEVVDVSIARRTVYGSRVVEHNPKQPQGRTSKEPSVRRARDAQRGKGRAQPRNQSPPVKGPRKGGNKRR
jgi:ribonuclease R